MNVVWFTIFVNVPSAFPNVSWYFNWRLLTCAQQNNEISASPLVCMCLLPSLAFYMCVYRFFQLFYLIFPPLPSSWFFNFHQFKKSQFKSFTTLHCCFSIGNCCIAHHIHFPSFSSPHLDMYMLGFSSFKNNVNCIKGSRFKY